MDKKQVITTGSTVGTVSCAAGSGQPLMVFDERSRYPAKAIYWDSNMIPQFSFRFAAVALAYSAVLCLAYFTPNVWAGWFAVIATAAVISIAIFQAFRNQNQWTLGFAVTSCATLITCLGFTIETRGVSGFKFDTDLRQSMSKFLLGDPIEEGMSH